MDWNAPRESAFQEQRFASDKEPNDEPATVLAGRCLLVALFVFSGVTKFIDVAGTAAHIQAKGWPAPSALAGAAAAVEVGGGLMIMLGWRTRIAAIVLMIFTAAATALYHDFWNLTGREQINQMLHAFKNVSMIGGLLILYGSGQGRWSLETGQNREA